MRHEKNTNRVILFGFIFFFLLNVALVHAVESKKPTVYVSFTIHAEPGYYDSTLSMTYWQGWKKVESREFNGTATGAGSISVRLVNESGAINNWYVYATGINNGSYTNTTGWAVLNGTFPATISFYVGKTPDGISYLIRPNPSNSANSTDIWLINVSDVNWTRGSYTGPLYFNDSAKNNSVFYTLQFMSRAIQTNTPTLEELYPNEVGVHEHLDPRVHGDSGDLLYDARRETLVFYSEDAAYNLLNTTYFTSSDHFNIYPTSSSFGIWSIAMNETDLHIANALKRLGFVVESGLAPINYTRATVDGRTISIFNLSTSVLPPWRPFYIETGFTNFTGTKGLMEVGGYVYNSTVGFNLALWLNLTAEAAISQGGEWTMPVWLGHTSEVVSENGTYYDPSAYANRAQTIVQSADAIDAQGTVRIVYISASAIRLHPYAFNGTIAVSAQRMKTGGNQWLWKTTIKNRVGNSSNIAMLTPEWSNATNISLTLAANETKVIYLTEPQASWSDPRRIDMSTEPYIQNSNLSLSYSNYDNSTNKFNFTVNSTGSDQELKIFYNASDSFNLYDTNYSNSTPVIEIKNDQITALRNNIVADYNTTSSALNITITQMSQHTMVVKPKSSDGSSCVVNSECSGGFCVHNICRSSATYCGDSYCDAEETTLSCKTDCIGGSTTSSTATPKLAALPACPTCPQTTEWSACANGTEERTLYSCSSETNYTCKSYAETRSCFIVQPVPLPTIEKIIILILAGIIITAKALSFCFGKIKTLPAHRHSVQNKRKKYEKS